jgi:hypothetical protein
MFGVGYIIAFCAFVLIIVQAVQLVYIPGSVANPNASKYKDITTSDIGVSVGMGTCTILILLLIIGLGLKA